MLFLKTSAERAKHSKSEHLLTQQLKVLHCIRILPHYYLEGKRCVVTVTVTVLLKH
jgi:hypothetical protein